MGKRGSSWGVGIYIAYFKVVGITNQGKITSCCTIKSANDCVSDCTRFNQIAG